jgi:hypothetical protein
MLAPCVVVFGARNIVLFVFAGARWRWVEQRFGIKICARGSDMVSPTSRTSLPIIFDFFMAISVAAMREELGSSFAAPLKSFGCEVLAGAIGVVARSVPSCGASSPLIRHHRDATMKPRLFSTLRRLQHENPLVRSRMHLPHM